MQWTSIVAIYALFWVLSAFLVMPFGLRPSNEVEGHRIGSGHAESAPINFRPKRIVMRATVLSLLMLGGYYLNYANQWLTIDDLNVFGKPPVDDLGY